MNTTRSASTRPARIRCVAVLVTGLAVAATSTTSLADDTALFSTAVAPNVVLLIDNSGSMNHIVWHEDYDPSVASSGCTFFNDDWQYFVWPSYTWDGTNANDSSIKPETYTICGNEREIFLDPGVEANWNDTRWTGHYLNWYFSDAANGVASDIEAANNGTNSSCLGSTSFSLYRRARVTAAKNILRDVICQVNAVGEVRFGLATFRRSHYPDIDTLSSDPSGGFVRVPVGDYLEADGSPRVYGLDGVTQSHGDHLDKAIEVLQGETWTPLAESLFQIYTYLMSRDAADRPVGQDGTTVFPEYEYLTQNVAFGGAHSTAGPPAVPDSPSEYYCQRNFVIVITDGEPARDDFDRVSPGDNLVGGFDDFHDLIGDYNPDGEDEEPGGFPGCANCEATRYLDDIAMFMHTNDMRPDLTGEQTVDVYTVGFTTSPFANDVLAKTATVGGGQFFFSNDAETLSGAIVDAVTDIIEKSQGFTAATVPASRSTDGNNFYTTYFNPAGSDPFWDGHLKLFEFTAAGEIRDKPLGSGTLGACALDDPGAPTTCEKGTLQLSRDGWWDAADEIPAADEDAGDPRQLFVSDYASAAPTNLPATLTAFTTVNVDEFDLRLDLLDTSGEISRYDGLGNGTAGITDLSSLADAIVRYIRGCVFDDAGCIDRGDGQKLWDIFHSNPLVVGPPNGGFLIDSYREFVRKYKHRMRVIHAGSNGGFLHGFNSGEWRTSVAPDVPTPPAYDRGTGEELFGFMPWQARQNIKELPVDRAPRDVYFVDGSPVAADVWLYPGSTASPVGISKWDEWHTVVIGGLRQGGSHYYALDITNPPDSANPSGVSGGPDYPSYMWEYPCESASCDFLRPYFGETWGRPIVTRVKVRGNCIDVPGTPCPTYDRFVAIVSGGYDPSGDPHDPAYDGSLAASTSRAGRAIVMIDMTTGKTLAAKYFDHNPLVGQTGMKYAIASSPAVFDIDFDGYADVIYVPDLGGNIWKWVVKPAGVDPVSYPATASVDQPDWPFLKLFEASECNSSAGCANPRKKSIYFQPTGTLLSGDMWLAFGAGDRHALDFEGTTAEERNRYFVIKDIDPFEESLSAPSPESPATTTARTTAPTTSSTHRCSTWRAAASNQRSDTGSRARMARSSSRNPRSSSV